MFWQMSVFIIDCLSFDEYPVSQEVHGCLLLYPNIVLGKETCAAPIRPYTWHPTASYVTHNLEQDNHALQQYLLVAWHCF